jgi:hypothetical protein
MGIPRGPEVVSTKNEGREEVARRLGRHRGRWCQQKCLREFGANRQKPPQMSTTQGPPNEGPDPEAGGAKGGPRRSPRAEVQTKAQAKVQTKVQVPKSKSKSKSNPSWASKSKSKSKSKQSELGLEVQGKSKSPSPSPIPSWTSKSKSPTQSPTPNWTWTSSKVQVQAVGLQITRPSRLEFVRFVRSKQADWTSCVRGRACAPSQAPKAPSLYALDGRALASRS